MSRLPLGFALALTFSSCRPSTAAGPASGSDARAVIPRANEAVSVSLQNRLAECVGLDLGSVRAERNVTLAAGKLRLTRSVGKCGCKSAIVSYRSVRRVFGRDAEMARGQLNTLRIGQSTLEVYIVLATDYVPPATDLLVVLGCENSE